MFIFPFNAHFTDQPTDPKIDRVRDVNFAQKARSDEFKSSLLNWLVDGSKRYYQLQQQSKRFPRPKAVHKLMETIYRGKADIFAEFLKECYDRVPNAKSASKDVYDDYRRWSDDNNYEMQSANSFGRKV